TRSSASKRLTTKRSSTNWTIWAPRKTICRTIGTTHLGRGARLGPRGSPQMASDPKEEAMLAPLPAERALYAVMDGDRIANITTTDDPEFAASEGWIGPI